MVKGNYSRRRFITSTAVVTAATAVLPRHAFAVSENDSGPGLSDEQFFSMLDLSRPELAGIQKAVAKSDWDSAGNSLLAYMRSRNTSQWVFDPALVGKDPEYDTGEAEKAMTHLLRSIGIEWQFGDKIDWAFNPTTQPDSKWPRNHEWTWQLSRHPMWLDLCRAYYATGDEKYAREFVNQLKSWVTDCPVPADTVENVAFSRWRTIEAGIRTGSVWPEVFFRILQAKAFDAGALVLMLKSFVEHAQYLMKYPTKGNWLTMEANGLYHVGALFPEFRESKLWRDTAIERLYMELDIQVYPDGSQIELAPGYHGVALRNFLGPVRLTPLAGFALPADYLAKLEKMFDYLLYSMQPDFRTPPLNDSGANNVTGYLEEGSELFPLRGEFRWAATNGEEGHPPGFTSCEFPYAGQFIMRSGWDQNALWLCMDGGPFGFGHQHEDKLSVILTAFGQQLLVEGGVYTYDASEWRRYVLGSHSHNVVLVDGFEQNRRKAPRGTFVVKDPLPHVWETGDSFEHAAARYDEGWGPDALKIVRQTRHVFFMKPDFFIVADQMEPLDGKPHTYEAIFHLDASDVSVEGTTVSSKNSGPNLTIRAFGPESAMIVKGQKEPVVQGWIPERTGGYGGIRPIPTAIFRKEASGNCTQLYVLWPSKNEEPCPVEEVSLAEGKLSVQFKDGKVKVIGFKSFT